LGMAGVCLAHRLAPSFPNTFTDRFFHVPADLVADFPHLLDGRARRIIDIPSWCRFPGRNHSQTADLVDVALDRESIESFEPEAGEELYPVL
jgi:hypothetical protein